MPQNLWSILFFCTLHTRRSLLRLNIEVLFSERVKLIFLFSACCCYSDGDSLLRGKTIVTELRFVMCPFLCSCHLFWMFFFFLSISTEKWLLCSSSLRVCVCWSNCPLMKEIVLCGGTRDRICDWSLRCWSAKWHKHQICKSKWKEKICICSLKVLSFHFLSKLKHSSHSSIGKYLL